MLHPCCCAAGCVGGLQCWSAHAAAPHAQRHAAAAADGRSRGKAEGAAGRTAEGAREPTQQAGRGQQGGDTVSVGVYQALACGGPCGGLVVPAGEQQTKGCSQRAPDLQSWKAWLDTGIQDTGTLVTAQQRKHVNSLHHSPCITLFASHCLHHTVAINLTLISLMMARATGARATS